MPYYLSKILPVLVMPLTIVWVFALFALFFLIRGKHRKALLLLVSSIAILWSASSPMLASKLLWSLEKQFPPIELNKVPLSDCIIVLGGVVGVAAYPRVDIELYDSIDRVYQTAKLFRNGKARNIIVAAGNQPWMANQEPEAERIRALLVEWGVTDGSIALDSSSKNTRENALNSAALIKEMACESNLLITTAWHMPRAFASFQKAGVNVTAIPVDISLGGGPPNLILHFIPSAAALSTTTIVIREWLGIWVYRWRDWN